MGEMVSGVLLRTGVAALTRNTYLMGQSPRKCGHHRKSQATSTDMMQTVFSKTVTGKMADTQKKRSLMKDFLSLSSEFNKCYMLPHLLYVLLL